MSVIFKMHVLMLLAVSSVSADVSGLRIANAIDHERHALQIELDGDAWNRSGMKVGEVSGLRRIQPGMHHLSFSCDGMEALKVRLYLNPSEIITLLPYAEETKKGRVIRVLKLASVSKTGREVTLVHVGNQPRLLLEVKQVGKSWTPIAMKRLEIERFTIVQHRGYLPMRVGKKRLHSMPVFEEGNHVVVIYESQEGQLASLTYRDRTWPPKVDATPEP